MFLQNYAYMVRLMNFIITGAETPSLCAFMKYMYMHVFYYYYNNACAAANQLSKVMADIDTKQQVSCHSI